jgi:exopolyphosphatase/guanosine-5'-triphosphate,3'-diphosphate pyrophosphatase
MIGTGGTIRNLAKVDGRRRDYPIPPLHGYELTRTRLRDLSALLAGRKRRSRALLPGLNTERADSIVGGAIAAECILERGGAGRITVAGLGLREGIVLDALGLGLPPPADVRRIALATLCRRFTPCAAGHEGRRVRLARALFRLLEPERDAIVEEMLEHAAACLDIGRSIDYYRRHQHTAAILRASGLFGFRHREIAKLAAIVELSDINGWNLKHYRPLLRKADQPGLARAGLVLALADQLDHRLPPGAEARIRGRMRADACLLFEPALAPWDAPRFRARFQQAFGRELRLAPERGRRSRDRKRSGAERPS